mmetsp:Transcript_131749/g.281702  ORF Transcript_131749/g.281702 Transcript_131749/m.281702 type:complete len:207 (-) Transcript_131749:1269-1889(-)
MFRDRRLTPSHSLVQALQSVHSLNWQSTAGSHWTSALQLLCSFVWPRAGLPHSLASVWTCRERQVMPPSQVAEHTSHSLQSSHSPSLQSSCWPQGCVLHGCTSSLLLASQGLPPRSGTLAMWRSRVRWPPPQEQVQPPQSDQSAQAQSTSLQARCMPVQAWTSDSSMSQPLPPSRDIWVKDLLRKWTQETLHWPQSLQSDTWHARL